MDQEDLAVLQEKYRESQALEEQAYFITEQISELNKFKENLKDFDKAKEKEFLASMGKGVYIKSELTSKELFVDVGSGILVKKSAEETGKIIEQQLRNLGEMRIQITERLESLAIEMQTQMQDLESLERK